MGFEWTDEWGWIETPDDDDDELADILDYVENGGSLEDQTFESVAAAIQKEIDEHLAVMNDGRLDQSDKEVIVEYAMDLYKTNPELPTTTLLDQARDQYRTQVSAQWSEQSVQSGSAYKQPTDFATAGEIARDRLQRARRLARIVHQAV